MSFSAASVALRRTFSSASCLPNILGFLYKQNKHLHLQAKKKVTFIFMIPQDMQAMRKQAMIKIRILPVVLQEMYWNRLGEFIRWYRGICVYLSMSIEEASIRLDVTLVIAWINSWLSRNLSSILLERILLCVVCITSPRCCSMRDAVSTPLLVSLKLKKIIIKFPFLVHHSQFRYV